MYVGVEERESILISHLDGVSTKYPQALGPDSYEEGFSQRRRRRVVSLMLPQSAERLRRAHRLLESSLLLPDRADNDEFTEDAYDGFGGRMVVWWLSSKS
mmetsp:Transcript_8103/g.14648  ORF Transcript_8103/g.14648 Transcript_8103/m.14648 type:complete len:100 (-) Transcript_8103:123-422(-)